jgi:hypothetical protein
MLHFISSLFRGEGLRLGLFNFLFVTLLTFFVVPLVGQNESDCKIGDCTYSTKISLGVCDSPFPLDITIPHAYSTGHTFLVSFTFDPVYFTNLSTGLLTNVVTSTLPGGFVKISGNFFVGTLQFPDDPNSIYIGTLYTTFQRNITWNGLSDAILVRIEDLGCTPSFVKTFNPRYNIFPQFVDLTPLATNSLFNLVISGILPECALGSGQLDAVLIDDELIIDTDYCFDNLSSPNITMAFKPGAKITVKSGYTLTINRMNLITCGDQLAQGIVVESGATLIMNNCVISDCLNAIDASDGATIALRSNTFIDNYIGLKLLMKNSSRVNILALENNIFTSSDAGIKSPTDKMSPSSVETRGYCGIYLVNYRDFNVFGDADPTIPNGNTFSKLANGIIGLGNVSGNIGNMVFEDIRSIGTSVYLTSGNGIYLRSANSKNCFMNINEPWTNMTFNNCLTAINVTGAAGNVEHTTITNTEVGIDWKHSKNRDVLLKENDITAKNMVFALL